MKLESGGFEFDPFPIEAQFSPLRDFKYFKGRDGSQYLLELVIFMDSEMIWAKMVHSHLLY